MDLLIPTKEEETIDLEGLDRKAVDLGEAIEEAAQWGGEIEEIVLEAECQDEMTDLEIAIKIETVEAIESDLKKTMTVVLTEETTNRPRCWRLNFERQFSVRESP